MKFKFWRKTYKKMAKEETKNPTAFTCGVCGNVHPFNKGFKCIQTKDQEEEEDEEE